MLPTFTGPNGRVFTAVAVAGEGAFGRVYQAVSPDWQGPVAVKTLLRLQNVELQALLNDIRHAMKVNHSNVVQVIHAEADPKASTVGPYLILEWAPGGTLKGILDSARQGKPVPIAVGLEYMRQIVAGMSAINEQLIHRDLKPDNILVGDHGLKITDFGISKVVNEATRTSTFKGGQHVRYMAPEGWLYDTNSVALDIYAAGLVFYEIFALQHPLQNIVADAHSHEAWKQAHLFGAVPDLQTFRADAPLWLRQLLLRMVEKRVQDRPTWLEIETIIQDQTHSDGTGRSSLLVEAAFQNFAKQRSEDLAAEKKARHLKMLDDAYEHSKQYVRRALSRVVDEFNSQAQIGKIAIRETRGLDADLLLPNRQVAHLRFFDRLQGPRIRGGEVIGGGYFMIGADGVGANLVLLQQDDQDFYGKWELCFINVSALVNPAKLFGRFGLHEGTRTPFALTDQQDFCKQIANVGIMDIFTYDFETELENGFERILLTAFS